jgi:hypothetical protein
VGKILPVPTAANGHVRFLVDAFQVADGSMQISQVSAWEWDGKEAKPLLIGLYRSARDRARTDRSHIDLLRSTLGRARNRPYVRFASLYFVVTRLAGS